MAAHNASVDVDGLRKRHSGLRSRIGRLLENVERFINDGQVAVAHETFELLDTSGKCRDMQAEFELCLTDQNLQDQEIQRYVDMELQKLKHAQRSKQLVSIKSKPTITVAREQRKVSGSNLSEWQLPKFSDDVFGFPSFWDQSRSGVHGREDRINKSITARWNRHLRQVVADTLAEAPVQLGGPSRTVELDEFLFSRGKYNRS
ncbi:hypothetical protein M514_20394 [Trichuris suis]|uniref:Uncharacterized protein n=1 Tax=Trichuris suis TaxID=68888 RepID=A0A085ND12_9BILA|nr:hypothetical protein M514_20394 [Trichuris suis]